MEKNPAVPPLAPSEEQQMFYQEHSLGITQFAGLEGALATLVAAGVDTASSAAIRTAFFGIESFRSKLEFADRYIQLRLQGEAGLLENWASTRLGCQAANMGRNKLAHWRQITYMEGLPGRRVVLIPPLLNPSSKLHLEDTDAQKGTPPRYAIGVRQLVEIRYSIFAALVQVDRFRAAAAQQDDPFHGMVLSKPPTLAHLVKEHRSIFRQLNNAQ